MKGASRTQLSLTAVLIGLGIAGCAATPAGPDPLTRCQAALSGCDEQRKQCLSSVDRLSQQVHAQTEKQAETTAQLGKTSDALRECEARAEQVVQRAESLSAARAELEKRLTESIAKKEVEIDLLNDQLSVRLLDRVLFDSGTAVIRPDGKRVLAQVAGVLAGGSEYIRIEGHTDNVPISRALLARYPTNWELSAARAISVVRLFQDEFNVSPKRLEAVGHALYRPVGPNDTPEQRQKNRRVEVILSSRKP